jgi:hypothetical protein
MKYSWINLHRDGLSPDMSNNSGTSGFLEREKPRTAQEELVYKLRQKQMLLANDRAGLERQERDISERLISVRAEISGLEYALELAEKTLSTGE